MIATFFSRASGVVPIFRRSRGFTLIELLVAVAVLGILTAVAIPSYKAYLVKGHRAAVQAHMMNWAATQSQYLADARSYATKAQLEALLPIPGAISAKYTLTVTLRDTPPGYTVTATPKSGTSQDGDVTLTLDSNGAKTPAGKW